MIKLVGRTPWAVLVISAAAFGCAFEDTEGTHGDPGSGSSEVTDPAGVIRNCHSEIDASGFVCTRCNGGAAVCLPAQCTPGRCLRCVDPMGHVATDCSRDYGKLGGASAGIGGGGLPYLSTCTVGWGFPQVSGATCHLPGQRTCYTSSVNNAHCITCDFPDGTAMAVCTGSGGVPLPDPLADRPPGLPAPGTCAHENLADGGVCETCTRDDMSVTRSCNYGALASCGSGALVVNEAGGCADSCLRPDGTPVTMCYSARGMTAPTVGLAPR